MDIMKRILNSPMSGRRANRSSQATFNSTHRASLGRGQSSTLPARLQEGGSSTTSRRGDRRYFGVPLNEIVKREELEEELEGSGSVCGVPRLVVNICRYINQYGLSEEGIFRVSGNVRVMEELRGRMEEEGGEAVLTSHDDVHSVAGLLKAYLRELPLGLIPRQLTTALVAAQQERPKNNVKAPAQSEESEFNARLRSLLSDETLMGRYNYLTFKYLISLLVLVSLHRTENKMSPTALGIVLGPSLFKCSADLLEGMKEQGISNFLIQRFITDYDEIFLNEQELSPYQPDFVLKIPTSIKLNGSDDLNKATPSMTHQASNVIPTKPKAPPRRPAPPIVRHQSPRQPLLSDDSSNHHESDWSAGIEEESESVDWHLAPPPDSDRSEPCSLLSPVSTQNQEALSSAIHEIISGRLFGERRDSDIMSHSTTSTSSSNMANGAAGTVDISTALVPQSPVPLPRRRRMENKSSAYRSENKRSSPKKDMPSSLHIHGSSNHRVTFDLSAPISSDLIGPDSSGRRSLQRSATESSALDIPETAVLNCIRRPAGPTDRRRPSHYSSSNNLHQHGEDSTNHKSEHSNNKIIRLEEAATTNHKSDDTNNKIIHQEALAANQKSDNIYEVHQEETSVANCIVTPVPICRGLASSLAADRDVIRRPRSAGIGRMAVDEDRSEVKKVNQQGIRGMEDYRKKDDYRIAQQTEGDKISVEPKQDGIKPAPRTLKKTLLVDDTHGLSEDLPVGLNRSDIEGIHPAERTVKRTSLVNDTDDSDNLAKESLDTLSRSKQNETQSERKIPPPRTVRKTSLVDETVVLSEDLSKDRLDGQKCSNFEVVRPSPRAAKKSLPISSTIELSSELTVERLDNPWCSDRSSFSEISEATRSLNHKMSVATSGPNHRISTTEGSNCTAPGAKSYPRDKDSPSRSNKNKLYRSRTEVSEETQDRDKLKAMSDINLVKHVADLEVIDDKSRPAVAEKEKVKLRDRPRKSPRNKNFQSPTDNDVGDYDNDEIVIPASVQRKHKSASESPLKKTDVWMGVSATRDGQNAIEENDRIWEKDDRKWRDGTKRTHDVTTREGDKKKEYDDAKLKSNTMKDHDDGIIEGGTKRGWEDVNIVGDTRSVRQLTKDIQNIKKRIKTFEEDFEEKTGQKPTQSEKAEDREIRRCMQELALARKLLKQLKLTRPQWNSLDTTELQAKHILDDTVLPSSARSEQLVDQYRHREAYDQLSRPCLPSDKHVGQGSDYRNGERVSSSSTQHSSPNSVKSPSASKTLPAPTSLHDLSSTLTSPHELYSTSTSRNARPLPQLLSTRSVSPHRQRRRNRVKSARVEPDSNTRSDSENKFVKNRSDSESRSVKARSDNENRSEKSRSDGQTRSTKIKSDGETRSTKTRSSQDRLEVRDDRRVVRFSDGGSETDLRKNVKGADPEISNTESIDNGRMNKNDSIKLSSSKASPRPSSGQTTRRRGYEAEAAHSAAVTVGRAESASSKRSETMAGGRDESGDSGEEVDKEPEKDGLRAAGARYNDWLKLLHADELEREREKVSGDKRVVQRALRKFEEDFFTNHGRRVEKEDRSTMAVKYTQYKQLRAKLQHIENYISQSKPAGL